MSVSGTQDVCIRIAGDCAVSVELGNEISLSVNARVRALQNTLEQQPIPGVIETVPTYASLMIHYQPDMLSYKELTECLTEMAKTLSEVSLPKARIIEIPILYGRELGPDLEECAAMEGITTEELMRIHSGHLYYTYMLGFAPGHAYMARFERPFSFQRREFPRVRIPGGSIVAAQNLSNLIPFDQPCGWNIIAHTPVVLCDYGKEPPCLVNAGDWVKFVPVNEKEYNQINQLVQAGAYQCRIYWKEDSHEPVF